MERLKYLIFGKGYVANIIAQRLGHHVVFAKSNLLQHQDIVDELSWEWPDVVVNAAGRTGRPNVDWCEDYKYETMQSNVVGAFNLAAACERTHFYLCHIGSGCVYEGGPFSEIDEPNFSGSFYSQTKVWSEKLLANMKRPCLQLRLRMPFDWVPHERNFIDKLLSYKRLIDVPNSLSVMDDFVAAVRFLTERKYLGIFNVVNKGAISHRQIIDYYRQIVDRNVTCEFMAKEELQTRAGRSNCVLDVRKLESTGFIVRDVHEAVSDTLRKRAKNENAS